MAPGYGSDEDPSEPQAPSAVPADLSPYVQTSVGFAALPKRAWQRYRGWPWWAHALAVLVVLVAFGGLLNVVEAGSTPGSAIPGSSTTLVRPSGSATMPPRATTSATPTASTTDPASAAPPETTSSTATVPPRTATPTAPVPGTALDTLVVAAPYSASPYLRAAFGPDWVDADGDCHNTRAEVLMAETLDPVTFNPNGCTVNTGRWVDPWDGFMSTRAADFQIDHTVPLADAWRSGASTWTSERRAAFAQNLDIADQLNALRGALNTAKSDKTPDQWKPPLRSSWCRYATVWVDVKVTWQLTVTLKEHDALAVMLGTC
jgi:hypothetical protein